MLSNARLSASYSCSGAVCFSLCCVSFCCGIVSRRRAPTQFLHCVCGPCLPVLQVPLGICELLAWMEVSFVLSLYVGHIPVAGSYISRTATVRVALLLIYLPYSRIFILQGCFAQYCCSWTLFLAASCRGAVFQYTDLHALSLCVWPAVADAAGVAGHL